MSDSFRSELLGPPIESAGPDPLLGGRRKGRRLVRRDDSPRTPFTPEQRLLILDSWQRFTRRLGAGGPTAEEAWQARQPISEELRVAFRGMVEARRPAARAARGLPDDAVLNHYQRAAIDRDAIRDTLVAQGLLEIAPYRQRGTSLAVPGRPLGAPATASSPELEVLLEVASSVTAIGGSTAVPRSDASRAPSMLAPPVLPATAASGTDPIERKSDLSPAPCCEESCTIAAERASSAEFDEVRAPPAPAHGEPAPTSALRRLITPLINTLRRAKIR